MRERLKTGERYKAILAYVRERFGESRKKSIAIGCLDMKHCNTADLNAKSYFIGMEFDTRGFAGSLITKPISKFKNLKWRSQQRALFDAFQGEGVGDFSTGIGQRGAGNGDFIILSGWFTGIIVGALTCKSEYLLGFNLRTSQTKKIFNRLRRSFFPWQVYVR